MVNRILILYLLGLIAVLIAIRPEFVGLGEASKRPPVAEWVSKRVYRMESPRELNGKTTPDSLPVIRREEFASMKISCLVSSASNGPWRFCLEGQSDFIAPLTVERERVIALTYDGFAHALRLQDGRVEWSLYLGTAARFAPLRFENDLLMLAEFGRFRAYATRVTPEGQVRWVSRYFRGRPIGEPSIAKDQKHLIIPLETGHSASICLRDGLDKQAAGTQ